MNTISSNSLHIRPADHRDDAALWRILEPMVRAGDTYALPHDLSAADTLAYWWSPTHEVFVAEQNGEIQGTYYLRANQRGGGAHVANCGYVTASWATGRGIATAMCRHSLRQAQQRGFRAMQFNLVVSTNTRAVQVWQRCGLAIVGRLPGAFAHPTDGFVDALIMYRELAESEL